MLCNYVLSLPAKLFKCIKMKKQIFSFFLILIVSIPTFAGGILTNTNQHISFLRMIARGASIDIDGVYSNPAGLGFMEDGVYFSFNGQSAYQTRTIISDFKYYESIGESGLTTNDYRKNYRGTASAPVVPSIQFVYKSNSWAISGSIAVTGGGGKTSFNKGLAMFDAPIMAGIFASTNGKCTPDMYTITSSMESTQYIFGAQVGFSRKLNDYLSVYLGGRMNYVDYGYKGFLDATLKSEYEGMGIPKDLVGVELDCDQTGWGVTPIIGADVKFGKWNIGLKYEFLTNLNVENKTKKNTHGGEDEVLASYADGINSANDIPALLTAAVSYEILPTLRASVEYHQFFDKDARMSKIPGTDRGKQKALSGNTHEYLFGAEWDAHERVTLSGGIQFTRYGLTNDFQTNDSFFLNSHSIGLGGVIKISPKVKMNFAYFWTNYKDYSVTSDDYHATGLPGTDKYQRTNKVVGWGIDYKF